MKTAERILSAGTIPLHSATFASEIVIVRENRRPVLEEWWVG